MEVIGENVDRLITVEMKPGGAPTRDKIGRLYAAALAKQEGCRSLTLLAAQKIMATVGAGDNVFILTGCSSLPYLPHGETDGPLGAASVARAIALGLKAKPLFIAAERDIDSVKYSAKAAGLNIESYEIARQAIGAAAIIPYPYGEEAEPVARELIRQYSPRALLSFEVMGPNTRGFHHSVLGFDVTSRVPKLYHLFDEAARNGILTIAGIDGGNELGSGNIEAEVRRVMPYGNNCQCHCQSGNACRVSADVTIPATTSNWAGYGISAMLGFLLKQPHLLQDTKTERRMLEACVMAGAVDGYTMTPVMSVDGTSEGANRYLIGLLHEIIGNGLMEEMSRVKLGI
jgi:hypothetical protein